MSLPASSEGCGPPHGRLACFAGFMALAGLAACSSTPTRTEPEARPLAAAHAAAAPLTVAATTPAPGGGGAPAALQASTDVPTTATPVPRPEVPSAARTDFTRAVNAMRAGNATEAELGFKQIALQYPQFSAPLVNLAILQRKDGHLDQAEDTLKQAVAHEGTNAVAWTELGVTQRERGEFKDAQASYEHALAVDVRYAPAWRNLGVLCDLYLGDPQQALKAFEQYKDIRQRVDRGAASASWHLPCEASGTG
jgi:Flp pilus assembly protein TadD